MSAFARFPHPIEQILRAHNAGMFKVAETLVHNSMWYRQKITLPYRPSFLLRLKHNRTLEHWCPMRRKSRKPHPLTVLPIYKGKREERKMSDDPQFQARSHYWTDVAELANHLWCEAGSPTDMTDEFWSQAIERMRERESAALSPSREDEGR